MLLHNLTCMDSHASRYKTFSDAACKRSYSRIPSRSCAALQGADRELRVPQDLMRFQALPMQVFSVPGGETDASSSRYASHV